MRLATIKFTAFSTKQTQSWPFWARIPVKFGEIALTAVLAMFTVPMTLGSSSGLVTDVSRICLGMTSNAVKVWLNSKKTVARGSVLPSRGMHSSASPQGIWVKIDDLIGPTCFANHADGNAANA
ncbi:hypothetical protein OGAPHI_004402 [Ogataea philodendri]|uniref:Uncharacterized protein n=1 Tax=Ogataea philodendri TaxID=1378263 RepID=A0A9P8T4Q7_9ASCO|nr:uncharacterized protein OGAPHI_004402 [Ogataea philodendri]KAH3666213.1 hypothetical protein OGAPHI_004402 [Ogataea philodendri]